MSNKLKPEIKEAWVNDLLANADKQGTGFLSKVDPDTGKDVFCCWGRLCELAIAAGVPVTRERSEYHVSYVYKFEDRVDGTSKILTGMPPDQVMEWAFEGGWNRGSWLTIENSPSLPNASAAEHNDHGTGWELLAPAIREQW